MQRVDDHDCHIRIFGDDGQIGESHLGPDLTLALFRKLERFRFNYLREYRPLRKRLVPALCEDGTRDFVWLDENDPIVRRLKKEGRL